MTKCPTCGMDNAYVGISKIECLDSRCKNYSESWTKEYLKSELVKKPPQDENFEFDFLDLDKEIDEIFDDLEMDNP